MNTSRLIGTLAAIWALASAAPAPASEYVDPAEGFVSSKSRDDVRRELVAARADGTAASCRVDGVENAGLCNPVAVRRSTLTRAAVRDALTTNRTERPGGVPIAPYELYFGG